MRDLEQLLPPRPIQLKGPLFHRLAKGSERRIGIIARDLRSLPRSIDVWVVPENIDMQLPRFHEQSMSAQVRYLGATTDEHGYVIRDTIADELAFALGTSSKHVAPGTVVATGPGELEGRFGVKRIYHVAATYGETGVGYRLVEGFARCITAALEQTGSEGEDRSVWDQSFFRCSAPRLARR